MGRAMPRQKPHRSEQAVGTPREFLDAVEKRFGPITLDLAATAANKVCELHLGPGTTLRGGEDALDPTVSWAGRSLRFCNPPFGDIEPWAQKAAAERREAFIALLTPASVGSEWFAAHIWQKALVLALRPRIKFIGHAAGFPRDLLLNVYGPLVSPGFDLWAWK